MEIRIIFAEVVFHRSGLCPLSDAGAQDVTCHNVINHAICICQLILGLATSWQYSLTKIHIC